MTKHIMIMGRSGSGKSTFALRLHNKTKIPLYHLDKHFFCENWVERDYNEFLSIQDTLVNQSSWIIDGNSTKSFELRYRLADVCLYFNFPRRICYWRVFKRLFYKDPLIDDRAPQCNERVSWALLKYMWGFEKRVAPLLSKLRTDYPNVMFIEVHSDKAVCFLEGFLQGAFTSKKQPA